MTAQKKPVYLDHHATTPICAEALEAMLPFFTEKFGNPHAVGHCNGRAAAKAVEAAREKLAALLNCDAGALIFTSGATEANNMALFGLSPENGRDEILIGALEHTSITAGIPALEKKGFTVKIIPANKDGFITADAVRQTASDKTALVSVMAVNHEIGTVQPIKDIAAAAHEYGALYHCDAAQGTGKVPIDIKDAEIDMLSVSGHKFYGPPGIGAFYLRATPPVELSPVLHGGGQQRFRSGTIPLPSAVGLGAAAEAAMQRMEKDTAHLARLKDLFLSKMPAGLRINGALSPRLPGSLNLVTDAPSADILTALANDLCLSTGSACMSRERKPSRVLKAIGLADEEVFRSLRLSMGRDTTDADVIFAAEKLAPYCTAAARTATA